ncbi:MAG: ferrous iron transport protein A [Crocinitomicaceae bacterium]
MSTLLDLEIENKAVVLEVLPSPLNAKMAEMGIIEGVELSVAFKAPFGDPIAIELNGSLLSLRKNEASLVKIQIR